MSVISWLFPTKPVKAARTAESSGLSRVEATRPVARGQSPKGQVDDAANATPANRKTERMARRELLYSVVRESMVRAGVLSASYKFKVLSLDARGRQFLVMMDLASQFGGDTNRLAEIEALIAQNAKARHDIVVTAVYWRMNEHVVVGQPQSHALSRSTTTNSAPMPLDARPLPSPVAAKTSRPAPLFEPLEEDEVSAFRQALVAGSAPLVTTPKPTAPTGATAKSFAGVPKHGPQSYTLLTGYEDTEMPDGEVRGPALSGTQYGELN